MMVPGIVTFPTSPSQLIGIIVEVSVDVTVVTVLVSRMDVSAIDVVVAVTIWKDFIRNKNNTI